jgi:hypothetical protein
VVGTPAAADLDGDGRLEIVAGADKLYAWRLDGSALSGFPRDLKTYCWSSPVIANHPGSDYSFIHICGWDGCVYAVDNGGVATYIWLSSEPIFATPTLADLDGDGHQELIVGAWDGRLYVVPLGTWAATGQRHNGSMAQPADRLRTVRETVAPFVSFPGAGSTQTTMYYRADFETGWHPVPLVVHRGQLTGLVQPFLAGTHVALWAEIDGQRAPERGTFGYRVQADWPGRIRRQLRRLARQ